MPIIPVRDLGAIGVVPDKLGFETPITAFSKARNVTFRNGEVGNFPSLKFNPGLDLASADPIHVFENDTTEGASITLVERDGTILQVLNDDVVDYSPSPALASPLPGKVSNTHLASVDYLCPENRYPLYRVQQNTAWAELPGWNSNDTCRALRSYRDFLIALDVSKGGTRYASMVKWSDAAQSGAPPDDWDVLDDSSLAGETTLNMEGSLVDGKALGPSFILYGTKEAYRADFIGQPFIFQFEPLFSDMRVMGLNCVASTDNQHFVFTEDDIFVHNGVEKTSIVVGRVRNRIFSHIDLIYRDRFFVHHDPSNQEVYFCYVSSADDVIVPPGAGEGCNEAAVFNYQSNTWTFIDLPNVSSMVNASLPNTKTWSSFADSWEELTATWRATNQRSLKVPMCVSTGASGSAPTLLYLDDPSVGTVAAPIHPVHRYEGLIESQYNDLDQLGLSIIGRKQIKSIRPQIHAPGLRDPFLLQIGATESQNASVSWDPEYSFHPDSQYKYDTRVNGRYLSFRIIAKPTSSFRMSGFDMDIIKIAGR